MPKVRVIEELPAAVDVVWPLVSRFDDLRAWAPKAEVVEVTGSGVGAIRRVTAQIGEFVERCEAHDPQSLSFSYRVLASPLPLRDYVAVVRLTALSPDRCQIEWSSEFTVSDGDESAMAKAIEATYRKGFIAELKKTLLRM